MALPAVTITKQYYNGTSNLRLMCLGIYTWSKNGQIKVVGRNYMT
jgi:hypothetical protein